MGMVVVHDQDCPTSARFQASSSCISSVSSTTTRTPLRLGDGDVTGGRQGELHREAVPLVELIELGVLEYLLEDLILLFVVDGCWRWWQ